VRVLRGTRRFELLLVATMGSAIHVQGAYHRGANLGSVSCELHCDRHGRTRDRERQGEARGDRGSPRDEGERRRVQTALPTDRGRADVLILCGDLTDYGLPEEAHILAKELLVLKIPMLAVLGNHDYEWVSRRRSREILCEAGVKVLDGGSAVIHGLGFAGAKGFCGGFGRGTLARGARARSSCSSKRRSTRRSSSSPRSRGSGRRKRVAILHYAPIRDTVDGEPLEIFPFLGCSRLEEPLERYPVTVVFHGHAHRGALEGKDARRDSRVQTSRCPFSVRELDKEMPVRSSQLG